MELTDKKVAEMLAEGFKKMYELCADADIKGICLQIEISNALIEAWEKQKEANDQLDRPNSK
jgi:hypothetical protein